MKKILSVLLAAILAVTIAFSSFAADSRSKKNVAEQMNSTVDYITNGITAYTVDTAIDYYYLAKSGEKAASYYDAFLENVKENLNANGGKIVSLYGENMTTYAAVIGVIDNMGGDPKNVNSVDLTKLLANADASTISNPYHYNVVVPVMAKYCDADVIKAVCDRFIADYYTIGSGMDYWGFASDNTSMFISAISQSGLDCYADILEDALNVLNTYKTEGGYCYNPAYGTEANVNSTGLALMAKSTYFKCIGTVNDNLDELNALYNDLLAFKGETEGSFAYDGVESTYSAADALRGISAYYNILPDETDIADEEQKPVNKPVIDDNKEPENNPDIPNTGNEFSLITAAAMSLCAVAAIAIIKKREALDLQ